MRGRGRLGGRRSVAAVARSGGGTAGGTRIARRVTSDQTGDGRAGVRVFVAVVLNPE